MLYIIFLFDWQIVFVWGKSLICKVAKDLGLSSVLSLLISFLTLSLTFIIFSFKFKHVEKNCFLLCSSQQNAYAPLWMLENRQLLRLVCHLDNYE